MIGKTVSHYKVLEEISRGGMGVVYRAVDLNLNREIALKVLPPDLVADAERRRRFVQEAQAAAALEHPHIAVVHEVGEAEGITFIAMELIRGEKLSDGLGRGRLTVPRSLELAGEVAEGLARAHQMGVVHRDLKPANIMVTEDGHAKIIDFGLAKLVEPRGASQGASELETLLKRETDPGIIMGTVSYMSPEQARGGKLDHRSDIFSFGTVLFEMLGGLAPFQRASGMDTLSAILRDSTPRLPALGGEVSPEASSDLQRILDKCLAKEPGDRYQGMKDLVVDLRAVRRRLESGAMAPVPARVRSRIGLLAAGGLAAALLIAAAIFWALRGPDYRAPAAAPTSKPSIAVLYFENNTGDPSFDWLRTALTDMLVTDLSQSPQIEVLGTDRLYQILKEMNRLDERVTSFEVVEEVAERARVNTVLLGSFIKAGDNIRISIKVQEAATGKILISDRVEGVGESSLFPMVDDLTRRIKTKFDVPRPTDAELDRDLKDVTTASIEAYRHYAEAMSLHDRLKEEEAVPLLEKAVAIDPGFAMALAKLSIIHGNLYHPEDSAMYSQRALEHLDRLTARERYYVEGVHYSRRPETLSRAIEAYRKAVELYPDHASARNNLAVLYMNVERYPEAREHYQELRQRRMTFAGTYDGLARCYAAQGEFQEGAEVLEEYLSRNPASAAAHGSLGDYLLDWGKLDEALDALNKAASLAPGDFRPLNARWRVFVLRDQWADADAAAKRLLESSDPFQKWLGSIALATTELYRGRLKRALDYGEQAVQVYRESREFSASARLIIAQCLLETEQPARALELALVARREAKDEWPERDGVALAALAQAGLGRAEEAKKSASELKRLADRLPFETSQRGYHQLLGELALSRGEWLAAIEELKKAESLLRFRGLPGPPTPHVPIRFALASAYLGAGDDAQAAVWFQRILESPTERIWWPIAYVRSLYFLGKIHEKRGEMGKAREFHRRFLGYWGEGEIDRERVEEVKKKLRL
jgi:tetratricopeptide (TPR) repeat protein/predicted Ser/Thr protein kinase